MVLVFDWIPLIPMVFETLAPPQMPRFNSSTDLSFRVSPCANDAEVKLKKMTATGNTQNRFFISDLHQMFCSRQDILSGKAAQPTRPHYSALAKPSRRNDINVDSPSTSAASDRTTLIAEKLSCLQFERNRTSVSKAPVFGAALSNVFRIPGSPRSPSAIHSLSCSRGIGIYVRICASADRSI